MIGFHYGNQHTNYICLYELQWGLTRQQTQAFPLSRGNPCPMRGQA